MAAPTNPAPASGPGALSRRTDGGTAQKLRELPNAQYGEAQTFRDLQRGAPLAQSAPSPGATTGSPVGGGTPSVIPLDAPTTRPGEPVTAGSKFGPGPGPEVLGPAVSTGQNNLNSARAQVSALAAQNPDNAALQLLLSKISQGRV